MSKIHITTVLLFSSLIWLLPQSLAAQQAPASVYVQQQDESETSAPAYNPPRILVATSIDDDDNLVLVNFKTIHIGFEGDSYNHRSETKVAMQDVKIFNVKGDKMSIDAARKQINDKDTPILCSSWHAPLPKFYATMFAPETLHFLFPKQSPAWKEIEEPGRPIK